MKSHFDPVSPVAEKQIQTGMIQNSKYFSNHPVLLHFIDAMPVPVMILNNKRQVLYSNKALLDMTGNADVQSVFGLLPGDVFSCIHSQENPGGCGSTEFCTTCGALKSILKSHSDMPDVQECRILKTDNEALDLRVYASPITINDEHLTIFTITDVSDEKRRKNLEKIFFHDLLNTASSVKALAYSLEEAGEQDAEQFRSHLVKLSDNLVEEICAQRDITAAENNELTVYLARCNSIVLLNSIYEQFNLYAQTKLIVIDKESDNADFYTDKILIRRILSNMLKNAVEATPDGGQITIGAKLENDTLVFQVNNPGIMQKQVQLQVFQRSFTTKGFGRGIGTYSMKLLCENYLKGKVSFTTSEEEGTTFYCRVPVNME